MIRIITSWLNNARKTALPQSILPALVALCLAFQTETFSWGLAIIAVIGVMLVHLGANLTDDYFDYKRNCENIKNQNHPSKSPIRKGKCSYLVSGKTTEKQLVKAIGIFLALAFIISCIIFAYRGIIILYFILITGLVSISYSGFPFRFSYHGMGELIIGLTCGPLLMSGVYYSACGSFSNTLWIISITLGCLVANILYVHSVMDYEADKSMRKKTLAVIIKRKKFMLVIAFFLTFFPYFMIAFGVIITYLSVYYLITWALLPLSIVLFYLLIIYVKHPEKRYKPRFWMGPMEQWDAIQKAGIDQFMLRWFLARNLCIFFCIIAAIVSFI